METFRAHWRGKQRDQSVKLLDELIESQASRENDFLAAWLDLAVARGDLESLGRPILMTSLMGLRA